MKGGEEMNLLCRRNLNNLRKYSGFREVRRNSPHPECGLLRDCLLKRIVGKEGNM